MIGMHADEVNVGDMRLCLRHEADEEGDQFTIFLNDKARIGEMLKVESRQQRREIASAPPFGHHVEDAGVIRFGWGSNN